MKIAVKIENGRALLKTPYNAEFVVAIKGIGGARWNAECRAWEIPEEALPQARDLMTRIYGESDIPSGGKRMSLKLTFLKDFSASHGPVTIFGKTVASAHGRDTGARVGDDVAFLEGAPESGGSVKNWRSVVPEGSVVVLHDVPENLLGVELADGLEVEVLETTINRQALEEEKARLEARLQEINALLAGE